MVQISLEGFRVEITCGTAAEFISVLDPVTGLFVQTPSFPMYAFRGVSSAGHGLMPSSYRPHTWLLHGAKWIQPPLQTVLEQCRAEFDTLRLFFDIAARQGLRLPEDSQTLRGTLDAWDSSLWNVSEERPVRWPPTEFRSLVALAQHYGVPTRALDWTWSPLVAAYFAARSTPSDADPTGHIAVWVVSYLARVLDRILTLGDSTDRPLTFLSAPGADNANLQAQQGLFLVEVHTITDPDEQFSPRPYDELLPLSLPGYMQSQLEGFPLVTRVLVPATEAYQVLLFAAANNVTGGSMFPGFWGVAREVEERRLLSGRTFDSLPSARELREEIKRVLKAGA